MNDDKVLGLTETGQEVKELPQTTLPLGETGQYYNDQVPLPTTFEANAQKVSKAQFNQNVANMDASALRGATELQTQGQQMQTQLSLGEYMRDQSAEKAGWTGGYMLDQARQGEYLKTSIQSQLYGAQELQRFGMETQLEAARAAYDLGKEQLALQYYNEAYQKALTEAQMFGYYVAPETRDMFNQYQAALTALNADPEDQNAQRIKQTVETFYNKEGLTEADIRTFSQTTLEMQQIMSAKLDAAMATIEDDPAKFLVKNTDGTYATDSLGNYITLNFNDITQADLMDYLRSDDSGVGTSDAAVKSYLRFLGQSTINSYFSSLGTDEVGDTEGFQDWLQDNPNQVKDWLASVFGENANELAGQLGNEININLSTAKGSITATFDLTTGQIKNAQGQGQGPGGVSEGENPLTIPPSRTQGSVGWNEEQNRFEVFDGENFVKANEEQINSYLNNWADDYKDLNGKKINWGDWYSQASTVADGAGWDWSTKDYINNFIKDQEYIEAIKTKNIPQEFLDGRDGRSGWQEIALFAARQVPSQNKDDTQSFLKNMMSTMLSIDPDDIEITTWSPSGFTLSNFPAIKIKQITGREWLGDIGKAAESGGKYVFYTQKNSGEGTTGYDLGGTGVNNPLFTTGTGLNNKWLGDRFGDYAYMIQQIFTEYRNRE
jgi:hypothetical protein